MANVLRDLGEAIQTYCRTRFISIINDRCRLALGDERAPAMDRPCITIQLYNALPARDYQDGPVHTRTYDEVSGTATKTKAPMPVRLFYQLDAFCDSKEDDLDLTSLLLQIFSQQHIKLTTGDGRFVYLIPEQFNPLDNLEEGIWRKDIRFSTVVWLDSPDSPETEYLVQQFNLNVDAFTASIFNET